jgi:flagellar motor protein MotB
MDKKHAKQIKRDKKKKKEKDQAQETQQRLKKQMGMFDRLPQACSACKKGFPKTREAHMAWQVTVRTEEQLVRLFCPDCQEKAKELVEGKNVS